MKGFGDQSKKSDKKTKPSKEQIINQAIQFHLEGNIPEALKYYQYCINQGFNDHRVFSNFGAILQGLGKLEEAEISYRKAIELKPDFADAYCNLGVILKNIGKLKEAEISYRKAIKIKPDFADAHYNLGNILKDLGKSREAEILYRKAIELKPDFAKAHYNLGGILSDLKNLDNAMSSYYIASKLGMDYNLCQVGIGKILLKKGNHAKGLIKIKKGQGVIQFSLKNGLSFN